MRIKTENPKKRICGKGVNRHQTNSAPGLDCGVPQGLNHGPNCLKPKVNIIIIILLPAIAID